MSNPGDTRLPSSTPWSTAGVVLPRQPCRGRQVTSTLAILICGLTAGCRSAATLPPPSVAPTPTLVPTPTFTATEAAFAANLNPLDGLPSAERDIATRRPYGYAVRGTESSGWSGIQAAEVVFENRADPESALTVLTLHSADARPTPGPLGTASPFDVIVAQLFDATLTAGGAPPTTRRDAEAAGVPITLVARSAGVPPGTRESNDAGAPRAIGAARGSRRHGTEPPWTFTIEGVTGSAGRPAQAVQLTDPTAADPAESVVWRYDPVITVWRRYENDEPVGDSATGETLTVVNVIILLAPDGAVPATPLVGTGMVHVLGQGVDMPARWERSSGDQPLAILDSAGMAVALRPGNTWLMWVKATAGIAFE